jgi:outer membrane immunogenic protein
MRTFARGAIAASVVLAAASAQAADLRMPVKATPVVEPPFSWTGIYVGGNAGWMGLDHSVGFGADRFNVNQMTNVFVPGPLRGLPPGNTLVVIPSTSIAVPNLHARGDEFTFGGQLGFNWQYNRVVFGVEGDINAVSSKRSVTFTTTLPPTIATTGATVSINRQFETDWMASIRGRLGLTAGPRGEFLIYGTGGVAFADTSITGSDTYTPTPIPGLVEAGVNPPRLFQGATTTGRAASEILVGGTWGAGVEWAFWNALSIGVEYRHTEFGRQNSAYTSVVALDPAVAHGNVDPPSTLRSKLTTDQVTVRLNWRFSGLGG